MLDQIDIVEDDWTSCVDDIDRFGLSENACPLIPPSQLHRAEQAFSQVSDTQEQLQEEKMSLVVQIVPAFGLKELSVYADPDTLIQVGKKYTFELPESVFNALDIDDTKCQKYRRDSSQVKIVINYKANLEVCDYDKYIQHLLDHIAGSESNLRFTNKNQFDFVYLCELFKLEELKAHIVSYMSQNVDKNQVFEFLRVASLDQNNLEARREAYWIIVFIFLKKQMGIDISESFSESNNKVHHMLKDVNLNQFAFNQGFLECGNKKIDLTTFMTVAAEEIQKK